MALGILHYEEDVVSVCEEGNAVEEGVSVHADRQKTRFWVKLLDIQRHMMEEWNVVRKV